MNGTAPRPSTPRRRLIRRRWLAALVVVAGVVLMVGALGSKTIEIGSRAYGVYSGPKGLYAGPGTPMYKPVAIFAGPASFETAESPYYTAGRVTLYTKWDVMVAPAVSDEEQAAMRRVVAPLISRELRERIGRELTAAEIDTFAATGNLTVAHLSGLVDSVRYVPAAALVLLVIGLVQFILAERGLRRLARGPGCRECGYQLEGLEPGEPCPECGTVLASAPLPAHS